MNMDFQEQIATLFQPVVGQRAWGAKIGWGSFVTIEFGPKRLEHHHYRGDWHLWLYQCDWSLTSKTHEMANSESRRGVMQVAIDNLNGLELNGLAFNPQEMSTEFIFQGNLQLRCQRYPDAKPDEECWMLFLPDKRVASLVADGLRYENSSLAARKHVEDSESTGSKYSLENRRAIRLED
jgi:hypothetical protein